MGNGYLGKISAIVSANTADFDGKLSKSAKEVSSFARSVQSNLTSASRQAARSLEGIYTPLQKFERSLQAAATMKLSFKGFPGMIKDLDSLQSRLNSALSKRQVDIVLKTTGMQSVDQVREKLYGLKSKDIEIIARFGGLEKLKELGGKIEADIDIGESRKRLADLTAAADAARAKVAAIGSGAVTVKVNAESVESLRAKLEEAQGSAGKLMGGEFMGGKSLTKAISATSGELVKLQSELDRATAARNTLDTMARGSRSRPEELNAANARVSSLTGQQQELAKKLADLEKYRDTIKTVMREIKQAEAGEGVAASSGDIAAARKEEAAAIRAVSRAAKELQTQITAKYGVDIDLSDLDQLIKRGATASDVLERLPALMDELGRSDLEAASNKMRQLVSVSEELSDPIKAAQATLTGLAKEVQAGFLPALVQSQSEIESLNALIEGGVAPSAAIKKNFDQVKASVDATVASVRQLAEVSEKAGRVKTGRELVFAQPGLSESLDRGAAVGNKAAGLPASAIASSPRLVESLVTINQLTREAEAAFAKLQMKANLGLPTGSAQRSLDLLVAKLNEAQSVAEQEIKVNLDTAEARRKLEDLARRAQTRDFTLRPAAPQQRDLGLFGTPATRGAEEALGRARQLSAEFEKLPDAAKRSISGLAQIAGRLSNDLQSGKADASALNQVLDRLETSVRSLSAAEQQRAAAAQARQRALVAEIAQNDRLITQERELAAARQAEMAAARQQEAGSLDAAEQALIGPRRLQERPLNEVYAGLGRQAQDFRGAVDSTFGLPQFDEFREQARRAGAEIQSIKSEIQRLSTLDPQRDAAELADAWGRIGTRVRAVNDLMVAGTRLAQTAAGGTPPEPPEIIDRNQDRLGAFSPMDRNAGNIGARTSLRGQGDRTDISDMGRSSSLEDRRRQLARQAVGDDIEAPRRQLASLASGITSLKSQLDGLPDSIRTRFVPAIRDAEAEFIRLSAAPGTLPGAIDAARQRVQQLSAEATRATQAMNFSQAFGGAGAAGLNLGLDQRALQGYSAQLQILQGAIGRASAEARGPAVAAFERFRNAVAAAFDDGNIDSAATRQRLAALRTEAVSAAAAVSGVRVGTLTRDVSRAGDVGRGGFDNFSLALNQAAFAIDDFMSSTGGLEFKLRAVSNNITQLAFILGGTTGLFVGLGAVIAGQAAVGLIKWANNGRSAEDQTKALNDALARQKGLVEELAQAFKSLGDSMSQGTRSAGADKGTGFGKQVSDIRNKQRELRENRIADLDPGMQRGRADRNKLTKQLESETDPGRRVSIQKSIQELDAADKRSKAVVGNKPVELGGAEFGTQGLSGILERTRRFLGSSVAARPMGTGPISTPNDLRQVLFDEGLRNISNRNGPGGRALSQQEKVARARAMADSAGDDMASQRDAIERMIAGLRPATQDTFLGVQTAPAATASETIARLQSLLEQLEAPFQRAIDELSIKVATASEDAARSIRDAQEDVAQAISRGVPGAAAFQRQLDSLASELSDADAKLARAVEMSTEIDDPAKREAVVKEAEKQVADVRIKQAETEAKAREVRLGRSTGGERLTSAINAMDGNERFKNERAGAVASARATADAEMQARRVNDRQSAAVADRRQQLQDARAEMRKVQDAGGDTTAAAATVKKAEADLRAAEAASRAAGNNLELAQAASETAAALLDAAAGIEAALTRIRKVGDSALQKSEQGADAAQRAFEDNPLRAGGREARDAAEERLINDRATIGNAQADLDNRRRAIQQNPQMQAVNGELEAITQSRKDLEAKSAIGGGLNAAETAQLDAAVKRETELIRQREMMTRQLTEAERKQLDAINNGIAAREKEIERNRQLTAEDPAFKRRMDAANQITSESERQANEAQQRYINNPTEKNLEERQVADRRLMEDRKRAQELQQNLDEKRTFLAKSPEFMANEKAIAENDAMLAELAQKDAASGLEPNEQIQQMELRRKNRSLRFSNDEIMDRGTEGEQYRIDQIRIAQSKRDRALRGRDLGMTERERFKKEFQEGAGADINARAAELRDKGENPNTFLRQAVFNQMESVAPMMKQFEDERQNARLQGPSRAALNVSDVSTTQGASELTRLLRGDDSAKDVNLAELRKQSDKLDEVVKAIREGNPGVLL
jgi:hypothetical protein